MLTTAPLQAPTPGVPNRNTEPPCTIEIVHTTGRIILNLEDLANQQKKFTMPDGSTCEITYDDSGLFIENSGSAVINIDGSFDYACLYIASKGPVWIASKNKHLQPTVGTYISALRINLLHSPIQGFGFLSLIATGTDKYDGVYMSEAVKAESTVIKGHIVRTNGIKTKQLYMEADQLIQEKDGDICVGNSVIPYHHYTKEDFSQNALAQLFLQARDEFAKYTRCIINAKSMELNADISGRNLELCTSGEMICNANMHVDNLILRAYRIRHAPGKIIDGVSKLLVDVRYMLGQYGEFTSKKTTIKAKFFDVWGRSSFTGFESLTINAWLTLVAFGATLRGTNVTIPTGIYFNILGLKRAYNFFADSFFSWDAGISIPEMPENWSDISNTQKAIYAVRMVANNLYKPLGALLKVLHKLRSLFRKGNTVYEQYQTHPNSSPDLNADLNVLNTMLTVKAMLFAGAILYQERGFVKQCLSAQPFAAPFPSLQDATYAIAEHSLPAILPSYVSDSILSFSDGAVITGSKTLEYAIGSDNSWTKTFYPFGA